MNALRMIRAVFMGAAFGLLGACGTETPEAADRPATEPAQAVDNVVARTDAQVSAAIQQNHEDVDAAIEAQSAGAASE